MKLLHVVSSMNPEAGGVCQAVRTTIAGLAELAVDNEVATLDAADAPWLTTDPFPVHALGPGRGPWHYSAALIPWLRANLPRFEVVILHGLWLYPGYALRNALRQCNTSQPAGAIRKSIIPRLFVMPHGMLDPYFQQAKGRRMKAWRNHIYWRFIENNVVNEAEGLLFTCETERVLAHQPFTPYRPRRELVVGLGVSEPPPYVAAMREAFLAACPELNNRPYLLFLSRINEKKGVELLLQAYAQLAHHWHPAGVDSSQAPVVPALVIAGPGLETSYGQRVRQLAARLPAATIVCFPGMLTGAAKWGAFFGCEAFVLPSHQENFGIAVVEALACGKAVLISNQVNIWREIIATGGGLVADDTLHGTEELLLEWQSLPPQKRVSMAQQARQCFSQSFSTMSSAQKMLSAISC